MKYQDVALIDSHYTLMLFCLLYPNKVDTAVFIVSDGVSEKVRCKLPNCIYLPDRKYIKFKKTREILRNVKYMLSPKIRRLRKVKNIHFYGQDHAWYSFIGKEKPFTLLEDGLDNYVRAPSTGIKRKLLSYLGTPYLDMGHSHNITDIQLTGILPIPTTLTDKITIVDIDKKWKKLNNNRKDFISNLFISKEEVNKLLNLNIENSTLIITQPLNQDGILNEKEKIESYKELAQSSKYRNVFIKRHPRDDTDYSMLNWIELQPNICPIEIFQLLGLNFNTIVTYNSTAALKFKKSKILRAKS